jgi:peptide/nickel transport system permease protein
MKSVFKVIFGNKKIAFGLISTIVLILVSLSVIYLYPRDLFTYYDLNQPPSMSHPLGTDGFGKDILKEIFAGLVISLQIGFIAGGLGTIMGSLIGFIIGYYGGRVDYVVKEVIDIFFCIPMLPILMLLASTITIKDATLMALLISSWSWPGPARQVRAQTLSLKERDFILLSKLSGMRDIEIVVTDIMPQMIQWMFASFVYGVIGGILAETGLAFIGLGPSNVPSLGRILFWANSRNALFRGLWWWWGSSVVMLIFIFFSLVLIHTGLDEIVNPRLKKITGL